MTAPDRFRSSNSPTGRFAELLLHNGRFYTLDPARPWAEAVAIRDGRLLAVGLREEMEHLIGPDTLVHDLEGAFCMPGLHDMHTHPDLALNPRYADDLDVGIEGPTPEQLAKAIRDYADSHPGDGWVYGQYWVRYTFREAGLKPGREWLDSVMPDRPVALLDRMWGTMMVNSRALELAGIDANTPDPRNGYLERDELTGEPNGLLIDGGYALIHAAMPPTPAKVLRQSYREGVHFQSSRGVTAAKYLHVCENRLDALKYLDDAGQLTLRVEAAISWQDDIFPVRRRWELLAGERHYYRSARLSANAVKFHFDGTVEPRSSFLITPWPGEDAWRGKLNLTPEHITDMVVDMDRRGIRVIAHCTGDAASDVFLDAVAEARRRNGFSGVRHQCAHSTILHPGNLKRFRELEVIAEFSPAAWYPTPFASGARSGYGPDRLKRIYDFKGVLAAGGVAVFGTDWPVASIDPWLALETLVTRQNPWNDDPACFGEPISLEQAIRVATLNGAYAMGLENLTGSLEADKSADFIVLDRNLFEQPARNYIHRTEVQLTFVEGRPVYDRLGQFSDTALAAVWQGEPPRIEGVNA
ncbi:amidohydrolase [Pseudomonas nitroreducens]|uniref:amidohydrolase n=1 Tax=Pseudomonas nitroreducens TaxID=46680 RepID=UPI00244A1681|nr:amidohydrolase [Pseudomonas nitroreducens]MDG9855160.1 amidohydrolase [Pseudomonas nitroreducens]MDH1073999.1 amidohydrolase [Pseudomonas nitroreducens]